MKTRIVKFHNDMLAKKQKRVGEDFQILPHFINEDDMQEEKEQPDFVKKKDWYENPSPHPIFGWQQALKASERFVEGNTKEEGFRRVCRRELRGRYEV